MAGGSRHRSVFPHGELHISHHRQTFKYTGVHRLKAKRGRRGRKSKRVY